MNVKAEKDFREIDINAYIHKFLHVLCHPLGFIHRNFTKYFRYLNYLGHNSSLTSWYLKLADITYLPLFQLQYIL